MVWEKNAPDNLGAVCGAGMSGAGVSMRISVLLLLEVGGDTDDAETAVAYVAYDFVAEFAGGYVGFYALEGVEYRCLTLVDMAVGLCHVVNLFLCEALLAHHYGVDTIVFGGVMGHDDKRGDVAVDAASSFDEYPGRETSVFVKDHS